jgi:hypothetical protein
LLPATALLRKGEEHSRDTGVLKDFNNKFLA